MLIAIGIFVFISLIIIIFANGKNEDIEKRTTLGMRMRQNSKSFREIALKKKLEDMATKNTKFDKKNKIEKRCLQAGFKISYGEYVLISIMGAIILPIIVQIILNNPLLTIVFIPIGYIIPGQVISFIRNKRVTLMDKQVGVFMHLCTERYKTQGDFPGALEACLNDFKGQDPFYSELKRTIADIQVNVPISDALYYLGERTSNKYLQRYAKQYKLTVNLGTQKAKETILNQVFIQYEEDRKIKLKLREKIRGPIGEAYVMVGSIPGAMLYQSCTSPDYIDFMTNTLLGKVGTTGIIMVIVGAVWIINAKIATPIE